MTRVLVIDDEPNIRSLLEIVLRNEGLHVTTAADGRAGLEAFRSQRPDVLVLDLRMPGLTGTELLRLLAQEGSLNIPVFVVSGSQEVTPLPDDVELAGIWTKPFDVFHFAQTVRKLSQRSA